MANPVNRAAVFILQMAFLFVFLAMATSCVVPPIVHVIRPVNSIEGYEDRKIRIFIRYRPMNYVDHLVGLKTPKGRAMMDIGGALADSYKEGLDGFFIVIRYMQYSDYVAKVDFSTLEVLVDYKLSEDEQEVGVHVSLKHVFPIHLTFNNDLEEWVPVVAEASEVIQNGSQKYLVRETVRMVQDMLPGIERQIYEHLLSTDKPGKYITR